MGQAAGWVERDLPVLRAVAALERAGGSIDGRRLAEATGFTERQVGDSVQALIDARYVAASGIAACGGLRLVGRVRLLERGRRATGLWPNDDGFDVLLALMRQQVAIASNRGERLVLEDLQDAVEVVGRETVMSVLAQWLQSQLGASAHSCTRRTCPAAGDLSRSG